MESTNQMSLDTREARPLTSREIAKIVSSVFFGFTSWCDTKDISDAMDHFAKHIKQYKSMLKHMEIINKNISMVIGNTDNP
jgi:hypothetical protein